MEEQVPGGAAARTGAAATAAAERVAGTSEVPGAGRRRGVWLLLATTVVLGAGTGLLGWQARLASEDEVARKQALAAAEAAVPDVLSYDHTSLDAHLEQAVRHLTPSFAEEYRELTEKTIRPTATKYKAVVGAEVLSSGVEAADRDTAQVLLFVNQTTRTTELPAPRVDSSRVRVRLVSTDDGWRVSAVEPL